MRLRIDLSGERGIGKTTLLKEAILPWLTKHGWVPIIMNNTTERAAQQIEAGHSLTCRIYEERL